MAKDDLKMGCENGKLFLSEPKGSLDKEKPGVKNY